MNKSSSLNRLRTESVLSLALLQITLFSAAMVGKDHVQLKRPSAFMMGAVVKWLRVRISLDQQ